MAGRSLRWYDKESRYYFLLLVIKCLNKVKMYRVGAGAKYWQLERPHPQVSPVKEGIAGWVELVD